MEINSWIRGYFQFLQKAPHGLLDLRSVGDLVIGPPIAEIDLADTGTRGLSEQPNANRGLEAVTGGHAIYGIEIALLDLITVLAFAKLAEEPAEAIGNAHP